VSRLSLATATVILTVLACAFTWPQCLRLATDSIWHIDPLFSVWRISWIAHALRADPRHLFDANIFYPAQRTLAFSDAALFEGAVAAPLLWAGVRPVLTYNLLLLTGLIGSGVSMFVLARYLIGSTGAALVGAAVFMMVPYRIEHIAHLELQWAMWMPLGFWALHRAVREASWRFGALAGILLWFQVLSCVYYGVFLAAAMIALAALLLWKAENPRSSLLPLAAGAALAALLIAPYAAPYREVARQLGPRDPAELFRYSATPRNYLAASPGNWIWGWTAERFGGGERMLFPGLVASALAVVAIVRRPGALTWTYVVVGALGVELSFGPNSPLNEWLIGSAPALGGLRAWARASIIAYCALGVLAAIGVAHLERSIVPERSRRLAIAALVCVLLVEYNSTPMSLSDATDRPGLMQQILGGMDPGPVLDLPLPVATTALPGHDHLYEFWSIHHWHPLVNGYSGYYWAPYLRTIIRLRRFPDDDSIAYLQALGVRYIVVHRAFYRDREDYKAYVGTLVARPELMPKGEYSDSINDATLLELRPRQEERRNR
jgi:hypothetical protein